MNHIDLYNISLQQKPEPHDKRPLPPECQSIINNSGSYVYAEVWPAYIVIGLISALYVTSSLYYYINRNKVSFMTRSPLTVSLSLLFLGADSVLNTLILSGNEILDSLHWQCNLGIIATVIGQMGFMMSTGLRIYRISKVYNTYLGYLENQKVELSKPTTESIESEATFTRLLSNDPMNEEIYSSKKGSSNNTESGKGKKSVATHEKKFTDALTMTRTTSDVKTAEE